VFLSEQRLGFFCPDLYYIAKIPCAVKIKTQIILKTGYAPVFKEGYIIMKICVNEILKHGLDVEQELDPKALGLETAQVQYPSGIRVKAHLEREKDMVQVKVFIKAKEIILCSRCLEQFESVFEKDADFIYKLNNEHFIDLSEDIKDTTILEYPIKQLCKTDCKGLCQVCGADLNKGGCGCKT
jgi:uncharacterized protein